ncbi:hypothetical protein Clacol_003111 [Clathrus columnatus]|uniref:MFS general substrate transporter n=1 Tax=Clathrus columnatus TaxID=1419009 RepID=A0AAV5A7A6_9AGAM|nr:hypothetical protein Clacol_003111 [Clathrus columnatus]
MESKDSKFTTDRSATIPETQSLLDIPSPYPPVGNTTEASKEVTEIDDFPEGGTKAWASVVGSVSFCMVFVSQGAIYAFGVYQDFYTRIFLSEHSPSQIAWIGSLQLFLIFFLGLFVGKMFDEGYFHHLIITGSVIYLFSFFMLSLAQPHNYYQVFLAQGVGVGLGMGLVYLPSVTLGFHYFKRRRGVAVGIVSTVLAIIGNILMRPRLPPRRLRPNQPKPDVKKIVRDIPLLLSIVGYGYVNNFSLASSAISAYVDNTHEVGFALGYALFIESFFVLIAQPVAGAILDAPRYRWNRAIIAVSIILYGGFAMILVSRIMVGRQRKTWKI